MDTGLLLLALEDFLPVVLSGTALFVLAGVCGRLDPTAGRYVAASLVLLVIAGLSKPIYKTLLALSDDTVDLVVLDDLLFWFLAPGFILLTAGLRSALRVDRGTSPRIERGWPAAAVGVILAAGVFLAVGSDAWFVVLLAAATLANVAAVVVLVRWASVYRDVFSAALFAASLVIVFGLAWAAASLEQTIAIQWGEQLFSTASQGLLLWGSLRLSGLVGQTSPPDTGKGST
jgi:hypothetical protein